MTLSATSELSVHPSTSVLRTYAQDKRKTGHRLLSLFHTVRPERRLLSLRRSRSRRMNETGMLLMNLRSLLTAPPLRGGVLAIMANRDNYPTLKKDA
jgi:hypothetical protein